MTTRVPITDKDTVKWIFYTTRSDNQTNRYHTNITVTGHGFIAARLLPMTRRSTEEMRQNEMRNMLVFPRHANESSEMVE